MKQFFLPIAVFLCLAAVGAGQQNPEDQIPIFNLQDYYVPPKMTMEVGVRELTGPKASFGGAGGTVASGEVIQDFTARGVARYYHDGYVLQDTRLDANSNPINDGYTNSWSYSDPRQVLADGSVAMHTYSATSAGSLTNSEKNADMSYGTELTLARDMGKIGKTVEWKLLLGLGINAIRAAGTSSVPAVETIITDTYGVNTPGQTNALLDQDPVSRTTTVLTGQTITTDSEIRGTYLTLRLGPTLVIPFKDKFQLSVSAGPALIYSGTTYSVKVNFQPQTGSPITNTYKNTLAKVVNGYFFDTTLRYFLTEQTGFYVGAFYESAGDYTQTISDSSVNFVSTIDMKEMQGFRAGLNFKF